MPQSLSPAVLQARRAALLQQLAGVGPVLQGSLARIRVTCGHPHCHCARGEKHLAYQVTKKVRGTTRTLYIPVDLVEDVRQWTQAYRRVKRLLTALSALSEQMIRTHVRRKRARAANQAAAARRRNPAPTRG